MLRLVLLGEQQPTEGVLRLGTNLEVSYFDQLRETLDPEASVMHSVANGKGNMPSFKDALTPEQIAVLWAYVGSRGGKEN